MKMKIKIGIEVQNTHSVTVNYGLHGVHITYLRTFVISTIIPQYHEKIQITSIFTCYLLLTNTYIVYGMISCNCHVLMIS